MKKDNRHETVLSALLLENGCIPISNPCHAHFMALLIGLQMNIENKNISNSKKVINSVNLKGKQSIKINKFQR